MDNEEDILMTDETTGGIPKLPDNAQSTSTSFALTDAVKLLSTAISTQFQQLSEKLQEDSKSSAQELSKKLKDNIAGKLKYEGNKVQYLFNEELLEELDKLKDLSTHNDKVVKRINEKLKTRQKYIRIADGSPAGWKTVQEYQCNDIADDSDDEKKIRSAENRALRNNRRIKKPRFQPYGKPVPSAAAGSAAQLSALALQQANTVQQAGTSKFIQQPFRFSSRRTPQPSDVCYKCFQTGHWKTGCPLNSLYTSSAGSNIKSN
ncbi:uncharacterized protein LOC134275286 [Saccostrea cucullata]|uniref:uncharacterized protein LOC134275286 n=1 Tax=Saccostrea cuccullata TaxID=36930 RepID=UPI002ED3F7C8